MALLLACYVAAAAKKKRKQPSVPAGLHEGCPFYLDDVEPRELSEFGHELERDGRKAEAESCYARAIRSSPREAIGWFDLAVARQHSHQDAALRYYRHGLSLQPSGFHYNQFGVVLREKQRHDEAGHHFRTAARLQPFDADALFNLGGSHDILGRPEEALRAYRGALERERKNEARIQNNIATQMSKLDRWREAAHAYREALEADPDFPETHYNLAHILLAHRRLDEAGVHLREAERLKYAPEKTAAKREELLAAVEKRKTAERRERRIEEQEKRDGHMTRRAPCIARRPPMTPPSLDLNLRAQSGPSSTPPPRQPPGSLCRGREERMQRMQQIIGRCGIENKACMREMLGQAEGATEEDLVRF